MSSNKSYDDVFSDRKTESRFVISPFALTAASILMSGGAKGGAQRAVRDLLIQPSVSLGEWRFARAEWYFEIAGNRPMIGDG